MRRALVLIFMLATVVAGGAYWERAGVAAAHADAPAPPIPSPTRAIDEYGDIPFEDEKARLDNFA
ncbi:MAG TPA: hypothetical protein VFZ44_15825, partial [Pyrinomonadaceae bacterium]